MKKYFMDMKTMKLVDEKPSDRYYEYACGIEGIIIETYTDGTRFLDFTYSVYEIKELIGVYRELRLNTFNFNDSKLIRYTVPKSVYDETLSKYGFKNE